eukprot:735382-Amphidinium_carterae.1
MKCFLLQWYLPSRSGWAPLVAFVSRQLQNDNDVRFGFDMGSHHSSVTWIQVKLAVLRKWLDTLVTSPVSQGSVSKPLVEGHLHCRAYLRAEIHSSVEIHPSVPVLARQVKLRHRLVDGIAAMPDIKTHEK